MRVWLDRGFSMKHISRRMLEADPDLIVLMHPSQVPDGHPERAFALPPLSPRAQGATSITALTEEHQVEAIVLQRHAKKAGSLRRRLSISIHAAATPGILDLLDDKVAFAQEAVDGVDSIVVENAEDLVGAVSATLSRGRQACIKPVRGVNGAGFWLFASDDPLRQLDEPEKREISLSVYAAAMSSSKDVAPRMVMEWLPGPEASVDLLAWNGSPLSHCVRVKTGDDEQIATSEHAVTPHAHDLVRQYALHGLISIQYRLDAEGRWRVLEINPRPAGGSIYSEDAGAGLIADWAGLITGRLVESDIVQRTVDAQVRKIPASIVTHR